MLPHQIPWASYAEDEIIAIVSVMFRDKGYTVYPIHLVDRSAEDGVDIECIRPAESDKLLIAVKIKPCKADEGQLSLFASKGQANKIYIYIKDPSVSFKAAMEQTKKKGVSFWNAEKLSYELLNSSPSLYIEIMSENSVERGLFEASRILAKNYEELHDDGRPPKAVEPLSVDLLGLLWNGKDRAVSLNKTARTLQVAFEQMSLSTIDETSRRSIIYGFVEALVYLGNHSTGPFLEFTKKLYKKYPGLLDGFCIQTHGRSYWANIPRYRSELLPGNVLRGFAENLELRGFLEGSVDYDLAEILARECMRLAILGNDLEGITDGLFSITQYGDWEGIRRRDDHDED